MKTASSLVDPRVGRMTGEFLFNGYKAADGGRETILKPVVNCTVQTG